ncbi:MAG: HD domain-containing phosphohydrolase [Gammaproteobacteria bacterium]
MADTPPEREPDPAQIGAEPEERQRRLALLAMLEDLQASRAQIERARKEWADAFDAVRDPIFLHDREFRIVRANRAYAEAAGMDIKDVIGKFYWECFPKNTGPLPACAQRMEKVEKAEEEVTTPETGKTFLSRSFVVRAAGAYLYSVHIFEDITERKRAEQALQRSNRALKTLSACNEAILHATSESDLLQAMCNVIVETGGYRMAWVGYAEQDAECTIRPVASVGIEEGYIESLRLTWADRERGEGPTSLAIRSGQVQITHNILTDPRFTRWRDQAVKNGYASAIVLPLSDGQHVFGNLSIYAAEPEAFDENEIRLLQELANDLAYGIITLRMRAEHRRLQEEHLKSAERLKEALTDTIRAIALTVEKRDPYTTGHQQKVTELCVAIGRELGLPEDRLEGLRLGALIHDIGKIYVPAEILNRPGRLSDAEFEVIKSHPQVGYDIVKDVKFPWPVAQMTLQHHERMDGSGYPKGLKGEEICLEARILAVADVLEAMFSHRPYRPAVGLDKALAEIEQNRGKYYDPAVVDACLKLFREGSSYT